MRQLPATDSFGCQQKYGMKKPFACAVSMTVWLSAAMTDCPLMKISGMDGDLEVAAELGAPVLDEMLELVAVLGEDSHGRVAGGIAHPADGRAVVERRDPVQ